VSSPGGAKGGFKLNKTYLQEIFNFTVIKKYVTVQHIDGKSFIPMLLQICKNSKGRDLF
jgi:hypothetical protein